MGFENITIIGGGVIGKHLTKDINRLHPNSAITIYEPDESRANLLREEGYHLENDPKIAVSKANLIAYCTPVHVISSSLEETLPHVQRGVFLTSQLSRITPFVEALERLKIRIPEINNMSVFPTHYLYNPEKVKFPYDQRFAIIKEKEIKEGDFEKFKEFFNGVSRRLGIFESAIQHDTATANTQCNTSRTALSIASGFTEQRCFPWVDETYSNALDVMKFAWASRIGGVFPAHVFRNIQFGNSFGTEIAEKSLEVEKELFSCIISGRKDEYRRKILEAKEFHIGDRTDPILTDNDMRTYGSINPIQVNSHFSLIHYAVERARSKKKIFDDLKAGTPNFEVLICLVDRLFIDQNALDKAISVPFKNRELRKQDLVFHDEFRDWANASIYQSREFYDRKHNAMTGVLYLPENKSRVEEEIAKSVEIVALCGRKIEEKL